MSTTQPSCGCWLLSPSGSRPDHPASPGCASVDPLHPQPGRHSPGAHTHWLFQGLLLPPGHRRQQQEQLQTFNDPIKSHLGNCWLFDRHTSQHDQTLCLLLHKTLLALPVTWHTKAPAPSCIWAAGWPKVSNPTWSCRPSCHNTALLACHSTPGMSQGRQRWR